MKHKTVKPNVRLSRDVHEELVRYARRVKLPLSLIAETIISVYLASGKNILIGENREQSLIPTSSEID